jgi:enterochelin esterase-like enzyme
MITRRYAIAGASAFAMIGQPVLAQGSDFITYPAMTSRFIESRTVHVCLPPGYATSSRRYPVIYFHDGQNAFSPVYGFRGQYWGIDAKIRAHMTADGEGGAIIVAIWNTPKRRSDYAPNAIEALLTAPLRSQIREANGGASAGDAYLRFIVHELKPFIDATYRTQTGRADTVLMGSSRGGMISLYGLCEHPHIFGAAACLSTHWLLVPPQGPPTNPQLEAPAVMAALEAYLRAKLPAPATHKLWMDHGTQNLDSFYAPFQRHVDQVLVNRNWIRGRDFQSRIYDGGDHNEAAWRARLADPLDFIFARPD